MVTRVAYPEAPPVEPLKGTLLHAAAAVRDGIDFLEGDALWESFNCLRFDSFAEFCTPTTKDFSQAGSWVNGFRFAAYGGFSCNAIGLDEAEMLRKVRAAFEAGESTAVERALMSTRFQATTDLDHNGDPLWDAPTDITPASGPVKPATGIALLEGYAANGYVGVATIHVPRTIASMILGVDGAEFSGDRLETKFGSRIAAGAGYDFPNLGPTGAAAATGERWLYATGAVVLLRGEPIIRQVMATGTNEVFVLAERPYIAAVDCFSAAIRVTVE